jgi:hypothetical protein
MRRAAFALAVALVALVLAALPRPSFAHGMTSAYLEIQEQAPGRALVRFVVPEKALDITPRFPESCRAERKDGALLLACDGPLAGQTIGVDGLGGRVTEAVVWASLCDGTTASRILSAGDASWRIPARRSGAEIARAYVRLGAEHVLSGADHLLFLLLLVLTLRRPRAVLLAETAFTLSHSVTFSITALGVLRVSPLAAEACIALSLVLVALDVGRGERPARSGAAMALVFGLVHGLGFAGGLREIGIPDRGAAYALLGFGLGVEIAQVAFVLLALVAMRLLARSQARARVEVALAYAAGGLASFWLVERVVAVLNASS